MTIWTAIVCIVAIVFLAPVIGGWTHRRREETVADDRDREAEARLAAEVADLRERIKVLERIAFDDSRRDGLADEIERLRD